MSECTLNLLPYRDVAGVCDACGKDLTGRQQRWCSRACSFAEWDDHDWNSARKAARKRDGEKCVTCGSRQSLEVNHIEPRVGKGYGWGCWNHQDNLETLCHDCHVKVTKAQADARRAEALVATGGSSLLAGLDWESTS
ncbi:HNH endonuclease [Microbacterium trichothecenolyticum]